MEELLRKNIAIVDLDEYNNLVALRKALIEDTDKWVYVRELHGGAIEVWCKDDMIKKMQEDCDRRVAYEISDLKDDLTRERKATDSYKKELEMLKSRIKKLPWFVRLFL